MLIIFEGFDKAGKTTLAKKIANFLDFGYFRSSKQINSGLNLEQAIKYDWRFFLDFINQVKVKAVIDRSFISQYVYSMLLKKKSILRQYKLDEYNKMFDNYCEQLNKMPHLVVFCIRETYDKDIDENVSLDDHFKFNNAFKLFFNEFKIDNFVICNFEDGIEHNIEKVLKGYLKAL